MQEIMEKNGNYAENMQKRRRKLGKYERKVAWKYAIKYAGKQERECSRKVARNQEKDMLEKQQENGQ